MKSIFLITLFIASAAFADSEDYQTSGCVSNEAYDTFVTLQPGDSIQFNVTSQTIFAPNGHQVQAQGRILDSNGTPYRSNNPSNVGSTSELILHNNTETLLRMSQGNTHTLMVVEDMTSDLSNLSVRSQSGHSFSLTCHEEGAATGMQIPCTVETLLNQYQGIQVFREGQQLSQLQIPEKQICETRYMEIEEASLQSDNNSDQPTAL